MMCKIVVYLLGVIDLIFFNRYIFKMILKLISRELFSAYLLSLLLSSNSNVSYTHKALLQQW